MYSTNSPMLNHVGDETNGMLLRSGSKDVKRVDHAEHKRELKLAAVAIGVFQLFLFILYGATSSYWEMLPASDFTAYYSLFLGVEIMMFIGFGYLMTFMQEYGIGAIGLTMMITVIGMQWALFTEMFWAQTYSNHTENYGFNIVTWIEALYGVAAVLISFGGVIGKLSPFQLLVMTVVELIFYSLNNQVIQVKELHLVDVGGTVIIHMFGAYFGLAVAWVIGNNEKVVPAQGYIPDMFAFIGTLFLWIYWPSFVCGALAVVGGDQQQRAIFNTILALAASSTSAFALSSLLSKDGTFRPVDIQNATLAGGVAIGSIANLSMSPVIACLVGIVAGTISTIGFSKVQPLLEEKIALFDTCGIHNLHGMPSVIGGLFSIIIAAYKQNGGRDEDADIYSDHPKDQWMYQLFGLTATFCIAVITGLITGNILKFFARRRDIPYFKDADSWHAE